MIAPTVSACAMRPVCRKAGRAFLLTAGEPEEYAQLEANLVADGCRDPLVTWQGTLLDGHNRLEICERHNIKFKTAEIDFPDENAAMVWIIRNQFGRRNITLASRCELAEKLAEVLRPKAKENLSAGGGDRKSANRKSGSPKLAKAIDTRRELAKAAGVGERNRQTRQNPLPRITSKTLRTNVRRVRLAPFTRVELVLKLEPLLRKKAKENQIRKPESVLNKCAKQKLSTGDKIIASEMSAMATGKKFDTRAALGKTAGVSARLIDEGKLRSAKADGHRQSRQTACHASPASRQRVLI